MEHDVFPYHRFFSDFLNLNIKSLCDSHKTNSCDYVIPEIFTFFSYGFTFHHDQACRFIGHLFIIYKYICTNTFAQVLKIQQYAKSQSTPYIQTRRRKNVCCCTQRKNYLTHGLLPPYIMVCIFNNSNHKVFILNQTLLPGDE